MNYNRNHNRGGSCAWDFRTESRQSSVKNSARNYILGEVLGRFPRKHSKRNPGMNSEGTPKERFKERQWKNSTGGTHGYIPTSAGILKDTFEHIPWETLE